MGEGNLDTTNLLLGIMAAVSVIEALLLVAVGVMAWKLYSRTLDIVQQIEQRHIAPLAARVDTLMGTVDGVLADVRGRTGVTSRVQGAMSMVNALRAGFEAFFKNDRARRNREAAPEHV